MTNAKTTPQPNPSDATTLDPVFQIQRVYLKELSLEQPNSPAVFLETEQPQLDIQLSIETLPVFEGIFEVSVTANVHTSLKDKTVFLIEAKQAAIFEIRNLSNDQMGPILGIACPQIIYPYLRSNVADAINRAGFPPVHLSEVNFQAMYEQQQADLQNSLQNAPAAND
jgi:preprotein translocase subunit SecB